MENTARAVRFPRSSQRLVRLRSGNRFTNDLLACVTKLVRAVRNSTFFTQPRRSNTSSREMMVRVLPEPVAITSSAFRRFSVSKAWQTAFTASTW